MNSVADDILKGLEQAVEIQKGSLKGKVTTYELADVKALRTKLKVNQSEFAKAVEVSVDTVKSWETGRRNPTGITQKLLRMIEKNPAIYQEFVTA